MTQIRFEKNVGQGSKDGWAIVPREAFHARGVEAADYLQHCSIDGAEVRVRVSPTSHLYLRRLPTETAVDEVVRAVAFAHVNDRPRVWTTDFALLHGARTPDEVRDWERQNNLQSQAKDVDSLRVPDVPPTSPDVFFDGTDNDVRAHLESVFGTDAFYLDGEEIVLELPLTDKGKHPRPTGETVHVNVRAPKEWSIETPQGGYWWHVVPEGSGQTLCTISLSNWTTSTIRDDTHAITCPWCRARVIAIEIAAPPPPPSVDQTARPTLHEEIQRILRDRGRPMTTKELAVAVNEAGRYRKRDGSPVAPLQIHSRTRNYAHLFEREGARVSLRDGGS